MNFDLCSGNGSWGDDFVRIDIDPKVKPDIIADIRFLPIRRGAGRRGTTTATPPCTYISKARQWRYGWNPEAIAESFELAAACFDAFAWLEAETCIFEWGTNLETMMGSKVRFTYDKGDIRNATTTFYSNNKGLRRAKIPVQVREAILSATEGATAE